MNSWKGRKILFIGDSHTARKIYPEKIGERLEAEVYYHCKGGIQYTHMIEGSPADAVGYVPPLSPEIVADKDLIVLFGGGNCVNMQFGKPGDRYNADGSGEKTVVGTLQYAIDSIYDNLEKADNLGCRILIVTIDCPGKNAWLNNDGYTEYYPNSGQSFENMSKVQAAVAEYNSLPYCDLFRTSGINRRTWKHFGASKKERNPNFTPVLLDENGNAVDDKPLRYETGKSYYQWRDGKVVLEQYNDAPRYPYNADQLHKSVAGYERFAEVIVGAIIRAYGI